MGNPSEHDIKAIIGKLANELHTEIGYTIDAFMIENNLPGDVITLNIVFNSLSNNLQAIVINNDDIPQGTAEMMIQVLTARLRKAYQLRINKE